MLIYSRKKLDSLNTLIKVVIKYDNKLYKLVIKIYYNNLDNKARFYQKCINCYSKNPKTNK